MLHNPLIFFCKPLGIFKRHKHGVIEPHAGFREPPGNYKRLIKKLNLGMRIPDDVIAHNNLIIGKRQPYLSFEPRLDIKIGIKVDADYLQRERTAPGGKGCDKKLRGSKVDSFNFFKAIDDLGFKVKAVRFAPQQCAFDF